MSTTGSNSVLLSTIVMIGEQALPACRIEETNYHTVSKLLAGYDYDCYFNGYAWDHLCIYTNGTFQNAKKFAYRGDWIIPVDGDVIVLSDETFMKLFSGKSQ